MGTSGALNPTKRAKKILKDLEFVKETYISYFLGHDEQKLKEINDIIHNIEEYVIELSVNKKHIEAELAQKIKNEAE